VNGTKTTQYTNIRWVAADAARRWDGSKWDATWGGLGGTVVETMYQYIDHVYVSGR
jgi:hypothetical protein